MRLQICESCWSEDTWKLEPEWKTIQLPILLVKCVATFKHKEWHFGLKKHESKHKFRLLIKSHWPDSPQHVEPTRCFHSWIFCCGTFFVAMGAAECFINSVDSFVNSNGLILNTLVTLGATEWCITAVGFFMYLQFALCGAFDWEQPKGLSPLGVFSGVFRQLNWHTDTLDVLFLIRRQTYCNKHGIFSHGQNTS